MPYGCSKHIGLIRSRHSHSQLNDHVPLPCKPTCCRGWLYMARVSSSRKAVLVTAARSSALGCCPPAPRAGTASMQPVDRPSSCTARSKDNVVALHSARWRRAETLMKFRSETASENCRWP